jgi:hypothetical protein
VLSGARERHGRLVVRGEAARRPAASGHLFLNELLATRKERTERTSHCVVCVQGGPGAFSPCCWGG